MSVLDRIIEDITSQIKEAATSAGYKSASILRDEYAVLNFPPEVNAEWVMTNALNVVIQLPTGNLGPGAEHGVSNNDIYRQHFIVHAVCYTGAPATRDAMRVQDLTGKVEMALKLFLMYLRGDKNTLNHVQRGGWADNTLNFMFNRWAYGDGSGAGFTVDFDVVYRTAQNNPDLKG